MYFVFFYVFFFNDTATTAIYTLSLHDALPICSHDFFERYGARTIVLARFVPIVRTFATVMAGASRINFRVYALYSVIGGTEWAAGVTALGHWLGRFQVIGNNIELIAILIVLVSFIPIGIEY